MYSGEYDACDVTLSVYPHWASLKNIPDHGGQVPTVARHIFQACSVWIYTQNNITSTIVLSVDQSGSLPMGILHKNLQSTLNTK